MTQVSETEKDLLVKLKSAYFRLEKAIKEKTEAQKEFDRLEAILVQTMIDKGATRTAKYDGIGSVSLLAPKIRAQYDKEHEEEFFEFVKAQGEAAIIKLGVHPQSLNGFVGRCLERGITLPDYLDYFLETNIRCNFVREA